MKKNLKGLVGYLAPQNYEMNLQKELQYKKIKIEKQHGRLFIAESSQDENIKVYWQQNIWQDLFELKIDSIKQCASQLKQQSNWWYHYSPILRLRCKLIQDHLPHIKTEEFIFPIQRNMNSLGGFTLLEKNLALYSPLTSSKFANGEIHFQEDKVNPPNRAYLKLWEVFTIINKYPQNNQFVIELGSSPGGWTWVIQQFGAKILSCDKSLLDPKLLKYDKLQFIQQDAFKILPDNFKEEIDWLLSDLICYPTKLLQYIKIWISSNKVNNMVCTIKFQGDIDFEIIEEFASIPNSQIFHLTYNKNELTFVWQKNKQN
ncbi:ribosomal RNA large subunit methyltransferase (macronuclear) [Tetrahymena thermophila SB210]|uniref:Ribosomal RNA large subunit methyltransferase n=1 Tax=Tetrahymena thermophila (strain SB210) TaxID=312017 RepID=I7M7E8_TETTS|nr:ribosomal RNA large subunit methyltransferase [Tetrahymena thermophila SB210]EAR92870.2 ribosomal RNA large subunit methyltransferase [Tetrahymena thermophila SB210]|eukprot:XP_001013115.2 ribosomal RNA large subunit methyltransferase [Tetrahymena thermophila SB210]